METIERRPLQARRKLSFDPSKADLAELSDTQRPVKSNLVSGRQPRGKKRVGVNTTATSRSNQARLCCVVS